MPFTLNTGRTRKDKISSDLMFNESIMPHAAQTPRRHDQQRRASTMRMMVGFNAVTPLDGAAQAAGEKQQGGWWPKATLGFRGGDRAARGTPAFTTKFSKVGPACVYSDHQSNARFDNARSASAAAAGRRGSGGRRGSIRRRGSGQTARRASLTGKRFSFSRFDKPTPPGTVGGFDTTYDIADIHSSRDDGGHKKLQPANYNSFAKRSPAAQFWQDSPARMGRLAKQVWEP